jgi:uncharacterized membrane protein
MSKNKQGLHWTAQLFAFIVLACVSAFAAWVVIGPWFPKGSLTIGLLTIFFLLGPVGALWMLYDCSIHEKPPLIYFVLAFVPYAFVWYYFDRVRPRRVRSANEKPVAI